VSPPAFIDNATEAFRIRMSLWVELPSGLIVGQHVLGPDEGDEALGRTLEAALVSPLAGRPRRPGRIRVGDAAAQAAVRRAAGAAIPVGVGPTPELDELLDLMVQSMPDGDAEGDQSYFASGRIGATTIERLFAAAHVLYTIAPWKTADDAQVLRMDIPRLGVAGACVSIIGKLGQSFGVIVFPSLAGYVSFLRVAESRRAKRRLNLRTGWLALTFERKAALPAPMRGEAARHGWPVAAAGAYPRVERRDPDGAIRPLVTRDVEIASACAAALGAFCVKHQAALGSDDPEPVCESYLDNDDLEVRFTLPYEAFALFDVDVGPAAARGAGPDGRRVRRDAPCPCGSGRKYKSCHLAQDAGQHGAPPPAGDDAGAFGPHPLERRWLPRLIAFAATQTTLGPAQMMGDFADPEAALQLAAPWSVYAARLDGRTVLDRYLAERGGRLAPDDLAWLEAQRAAWLSIWEVTAVEPGVGLTLRDLLSGATRRVREHAGSQVRVARDALLARVVDHGGISVLCGTHHRPLPPSFADRAVRAIRRKLPGGGKGPVPPEALRAEGIGPALIRAWERAAGEHLQALQAHPPVDADDDVRLTTDHVGAAEPAPEGPEVLRLIEEYKRRHYADWLDAALPALGGRTPRRAARTAGGRAALDLLLRDMENREQRLASGPRFDFSMLRRELRLDS